MERMLIFAAIVLLLIAQPSLAQIPQIISYQGLLTDASGKPVSDKNYSLTFRLYNQDTGGAILWTETYPTLAVVKGVFNVILGSISPLTLPFDQQYWLGVAVDGGTELSPRIKLTSVAYSLNALSVADNAVTSSKIAGNAVTVDKIQPNVVSSVDGVSNDGGNIDLIQQNAVTITPNDANNTITIGESHSARTDNPHNVTATQTGALVSVEGVSNPGGNINLVSGSNITISHDDNVNTITIASNSWGLNGNSGTTPGTNFLGTKDNVALELRVNGYRAFRLEPNEENINIIGGYYKNSVTPGAKGAAIGGGGVYGSLNLVTDSFGTIGGGLGNQAGNNAGTIDDRTCATVGGGSGNSATGYASTVSGGAVNDATGYCSAISGGYKNSAAGQYSLAAGRRAKANHNGSFVWGDSTDADVASTMPNQFVVRANGGVQFRDSQEVRISDIDDTVLVLEADTNNSGEDDNPGLLLVQDGGAVEGFLGYEEGTNRLLLENRYPDRLQLKSSGGISLYTNDAKTKGMFLYDDSTVGGGESNQATGDWATVPGGRNNSALGDYSFAAGRNAKAQDKGTFVWADSSENNIIVFGENRFVVRASGGISLYTNPASTTGMFIPAGGSGWDVVSDRNMKDNIREVDKKDILNKLSNIPITRWSYKTQKPSIEHIGPMAQDWKEAFGLGDDDRSINSIDTDGVALAAIQGLYELAKEKDAKIAEQESRIAQLEARLAALERLINSGSQK